MEQQRNLIIAVVISIAILIGFEYFVAPKVKPTAHPPAQTQGQSAAPATGKTAAVPAAPSGVIAPVPVTRDAALGKSARIKISTPRLAGSIDLSGARLDDLTLTDFHETTAPDSPLVQLLSPDGTADPYFADFGWVAGESAVKTPDATTAWQTADKTLGIDHPVTLTWDNGQGLRFTRKIAVDGDYMFTVTQTVENHGGKPVTLFPYARIDRGGKTPVQSNRLLHVG